jgi:hypothetical protein
MSCDALRRSVEGVSRQELGNHLWIAASGLDLEKTNLIHDFL